MSFHINCEPTNELGPTRVPSKLPQYAHLPQMLWTRSLGVDRLPIGFTDTVLSSTYNSFDVIDNKNTKKFDHYCGGVFCLEYSLDGRLLVAACEGKQVLIYDSGNQKRIKTVDNAHSSCVNCVKFLDSVTFATGSDDSFIKLWDMRNLKSATRTLDGHSSWVKNIEWSAQDQVMVTSAFDGTVYAWNLKEKTENNMLYEKVFLMNGLMRMKLTPDGTKMIISTTTGFMVIIHDLHLLSLATDLKWFRPALYRLMQTSEQSFPIATTFNYLFNPLRTRNRIEFIDDFPNGADSISSLQIHPHGWAAVSRNLKEEETQEWTSVHDIQDRDPKEYEDAFIYVDNMQDDEDLANDDEADEESPQGRQPQIPTDLWMSFIAIDSYDDSSNITSVMSVVNSGLISPNPSFSSYFKQHPNERNKIIKNIPRMTHYAKEKHVGRGFIKELAISSDGRIICSPYDKGLRLLGFSETCQEMSDCVTEKPQQLQTILEMNDYHRDIVVSSKFSPTHHQLVTGCLGSEIKWYQPKL